jgi:hypothetical protein
MGGGFKNFDTRRSGMVNLTKYSVGAPDRKALKSKWTISFFSNNKNKLRLLFVLM